MEANMKGFRALACVLLISPPVLGYSGTLVVSQDLALEYPELELISHSSNMLILKYDDWVLSHQVVDGESMYSQVDLTGVTGEFIQSIFIPEKRSVLPNWLQLLAEEQGRVSVRI
jgi:heme A synthase